MTEFCIVWFSTCFFIGAFGILGGALTAFMLWTFIDIVDYYHWKINHD